MEEKKTEKKNQKQEDLKQKLEECQKLRDEYLAGWQRAQADFLNYKREEAERIRKVLDYALEEWISKVLSILDYFEIAEKNIPDELKNNANVDGILRIKNQFVEFLKNEAVEGIKTTGEMFDPNFHEAVDIVESEKESGRIIEEIQKGYLIQGKILRAAKVRVAK